VESLRVRKSTEQEAGIDGWSDPEVDAEDNTMESLILAQDER
jgi:hypothetical protein